MRTHEAQFVLKNNNTGSEQDFFGRGEGPPTKRGPYHRGKTKKRKNVRTLQLATKGPPPRKSGMTHAGQKILSTHRSHFSFKLFIFHTNINCSNHEFVHSEMLEVSL